MLKEAAAGAEAARKSAERVKEAGAAARDAAKEKVKEGAKAAKEAAKAASLAAFRLTGKGARMLVAALASMQYPCPTCEECPKTPYVLNRGTGPDPGVPTVTGLQMLM